MTSDILAKHATHASTAFPVSKIRGVQLIQKVAIYCRVSTEDRKPAGAAAHGRPDPRLCAALPALRGLSLACDSFRLLMSWLGSLRLFGQVHLVVQVRALVSSVLSSPRQGLKLSFAPRPRRLSCSAMTGRLGPGTTSETQPFVPFVTPSRWSRILGCGGTPAYPTLQGIRCLKALS